MHEEKLNNENPEENVARKVSQMSQRSLKCLRTAEIYFIAVNVFLGYVLTKSADAYLG
jgi:hypothetical protein